MIQMTKNVKDGEFLITAEEAMKYGSTLLDQADVVDAAKPIQLVAMLRVINENGVAPVAYETGSKVTPLYRSVDIGVDGNAILNG